MILWVAGGQIIDDSTILDLVISSYSSRARRLMNSDALVPLC